MRDFVHDMPAARVVFGTGSLDRVPDELAALGVSQPLVIAAGAAGPAGDKVAAALPTATRFSRVAQHVPEQLAHDAVAAARSAGVDGLCSVGGGSATGLAKAVAVALDLPIVAVPTTYAGSEATTVHGVTGERKRTATDARARPRTVVYDPALSAGLPPRTTATSAFNALAHATRALTTTPYDPVARLYAAEAIRLITGALPLAIRQGDDLDARGDLLWAAWLAGTSLSVTGSGLHHRLCHVLGGSFGLVHAEAHTVLLPHTLGRDGDLDAVAQTLDTDDPATSLRELARQVDAPTTLAEIGMPDDHLATAARLAADLIGTHDPAWFRALLDTAYRPTERTPS